MQTRLPSSLVERHQALTAETSRIAARLSAGPVANPLLGTPPAGSGAGPDFATALTREVEAAAYRIAAQVSSGPYTTALLEQMRHPYSKRHPRPPLPAGMINFQTGRFASSWRIRAQVVGTRIEVEITNTSPEAEYLLHGTRRMIARPYEALIRDRLRSELPRIWRQTAAQF